MTRRLRIEWRAGDKVTGLLSVPPHPGSAAVLLAHGAGAGQRHSFMSGLRRRITEAGITTMTFDYPYMDAGRKAPDRIDRLLECHGAVLARLSDYADAVVLAGKSMGGRMATHLASYDPEVAGVVVYGYPLVALGKTEPRDTSHLRMIAAPVLVLQGERDRLGPIDLMAPVVARMPAARMVVVADADHGFAVPKRTGLDADDVLDLLASETTGFVAQTRGGGP